MKKRIIISHIILALIFFGACGDSLTNYNDPEDTLLKLMLLSAMQTGTPPTLEQKMRGIWLIGGAANIAGTTMVREIDLYDPVTNTWYPDVAANATGSYTPTAHNMVVSVAGKIYAIGGAINATTVTDSVYEYDIATNTWTAKASIGSPGASQVRMSSAVYTHANKIYLLGGTNTNITTNGQNTHFRFDPSGDGSWYTGLAVFPTLPAPGITARVGFGVYNFSGSVSFAGGRLGTVAGTTQATNDIYMVPTNTYTTGQTEQALSSTRAHMASSGYAGSNGTFFFLAGGANTFTAASAFFGFTAISYVPQASSFVIYIPPSTASGILLGNPHPSFVLGDTTKGIVFCSGVVSPYNGTSSIDPTFYVFGGIKNMNTVTTEVYSISANGTVSGTNYITPTNWTAQTAMPRARFGHSSVIINQ